MFHFSADRLAGLDAMILKITSPPKVPTVISNHALNNVPYIPVKKLKKQKPQRASRPPLVDKTTSNNLAPPPPRSTNPMFLDVPNPPSESNVLPTDDSSGTRVLPSPRISSFRPLPPLPSASTLQLPSFLNFATQSFEEPPHQRSTTSLPASVLFRVSSTPASSRRRVVIRKTKNKKVFEGPQWIPAFHHPNSPYVPWSPSVRQRILTPASPLPPSGLSSPCHRSGAVAPEPWASFLSSEAPTKSGKERLSNSWKSLKNSVRKGVKNVVTRLGKSKKSLRMLCNSEDMLRTYDDADTATTTAFHPNMTSTAVTSPSAIQHGKRSRDSLASFASSDSKTLAAWLAERRATASDTTNDTPREMSVEDYELIGSWLDLRQCDGEWACGIQDCGLHTPGGSPHVMDQCLTGFCMAMPFDTPEPLVATSPSPSTKAEPSLSGLFAAPPRFYSLPRLPCQSFKLFACEAMSGAKADTGCLARCRETSMPGGWTFS